MFICVLIEDIGILDTISTLREERDPDLNLQCDIFEEELTADSEAMEEQRKAASVDISDPEALFKAILSRVCIYIDICYDDDEIDDDYLIKYYRIYFSSRLKSDLCLRILMASEYQTNF